MKKFRIIMGVIVLIIGIAMLFMLGLEDKLANSWNWKTITVGLTVGLSPLVLGSGICMILWHKL